MWASIQAFITANDAFLNHDNRNESTPLARQWQIIIGVIDHAVIVLCHPRSWDEILKGVPNMSYTSGEPVVFYEDMAMTTIGPNPIEPAPHILDKRFHVNDLYL